MDGFNLEGKWPTGNRCRYRFATLDEALLACEQERHCDGVSVDGGLMCEIARDSRLVTDYWPGHVQVPFRYELRSSPAHQLRYSRSYLFQRRDKVSGSDDECQNLVRHAQDLQPSFCPVRTSEALLGERAGSNERAASSAVGGGRWVARDPPSAARLDLESISARQAEQSNARDVSEGRCPSVDRASSGAHSRAPGGCAAAPLAEQLELMDATLSGREGCAGAEGASGAAGACALMHSGLNDGWGAQHYRRANTFLLAVQAGCIYEHVPLVRMNAHSMLHGTSHLSAEAFFGLGKGCATAGPARPPLARGGSCHHPLGMSPLGVLPPRSEHMLASLCNRTVGDGLEAWRAAARGRLITCEHPPPWPLSYRCATLRAVAALRRRYLNAHAGRPPLPWFEPAAPSPAESALAVHVVVHVRRGDLWFRDRARLISNERWSRAFRVLADALAEARERWKGPKPLDITVHIISESNRQDALWSRHQTPQRSGPGAAAGPEKASAAVALPRDEWEEILGAANITSAWHLDADTLASMHHMIGADVLVKSISAFSDVASLYSAGLKLVFSDSADTFGHGVRIEGPGPTRGSDAGRAFQCKLREHLRWKSKETRHGHGGGRRHSE